MISLSPPRITNDKAIKEQVEWLNDRELMRYSEQRHKKHSFGTQLAYIKYFIHHPSNVLREIHNDKGIMVGTISAYVDTQNRIADVGILIGTGWGGKGYGYSGWMKMCEYLFDTLNIRRIEAGCMADNHAMMKICRKFGMAEEGRRYSHFIVDGRYSDLVLFGRFR